MPDSVPMDKKSLLIGLASAAALALVDISAYVHSGTSWRDLLLALVLPPAVGACGALFLHWRFHAWLSGFTAGVCIGIFSALPLLSGESFDGEFFVASATLLFFIILGFIIGAIAEFIRLLHFIVHGGRIRDYPGRVRKDAAPPEPGV